MRRRKRSESSINDVCTEWKVKGVCRIEDEVRRLSGFNQWASADTGRGSRLLRKKTVDVIY